MGKHVVCNINELRPGGRKIVSLEGRSIGVFNIGGELYALRNRCPHQGAPLCVGKVDGIVHSSGPGEYTYERDGEVVRCPWHAWEFDITTGKSLFDPAKCYVKTYEVEVVAGSSDDELPSVETYPAYLEAEWVIVEV